MERRSGRVAGDRVPASGPANFASSMTEEDLVRLRAQYQIPDRFRLVVPKTEDRVSSCPSGGVALYEESFRAGLRLPFHPFLRNIFDFYRAVPAQLTPNSIRYICCFVIVCYFLGLRLRVSLFRAFFVLKHHPSENGWWFLGPRPGRVLFSGLPSSIHNWKTRFFYVFCETSLGVRWVWSDPDSSSSKNSVVNPEDERDYCQLLNSNIPSQQELLTGENISEVGLGPAGVQEMKFSVDALKNIGRKRSTVEEAGKGKRAIAKKPRPSQVVRSPGAGASSHREENLRTGNIPIAVDDVEVPSPPPSVDVSAGALASSKPALGTKQNHPSSSKPDSPLPEEEMTTMKARVKANASALNDKKLAGKLLDMILLPRDQEERRTRSIEEVFTDLFPQLLSLVHDIFILKEASEMSDRKTSSLQEEVKSAKTKARAAEVKAARLEEELQSLRVSMENQLAKEKAYAADLEIKLGDATSKGMILESRVETLRLELRKATAEAEEASKRVDMARHQAVEDYRGSQDFEDEIGEAAFDAFEKGFEECKEKIGRAFPELDLSHISVVEPEQQADVGEEEAGEEKQEETVKPTTANPTEISSKDDARPVEVARGNSSVREAVSKTMAEVGVLITTAMGSISPGPDPRRASPE